MLHGAAEPLAPRRHWEQCNLFESTCIKPRLCTRVHATYSIAKLELEQLQSRICTHADAHQENLCTDLAGRDAKRKPNCGFAAWPAMVAS